MTTVKYPGWWEVECCGCQDSKLQSKGFTVRGNCVAFVLHVFSCTLINQEIRLKTWGWYNAELLMLSDVVWGVYVKSVRGDLFTILFTIHSSIVCFPKWWSTATAHYLRSCCQLRTQFRWRGLDKIHYKIQHKPQTTKIWSHPWLNVDIEEVANLLTWS